MGAVPGDADDSLRPDLRVLTVVGLRPCSRLRRRTVEAARFDQRGFTLIELLVTLSLFAVALTAIFDALGVLTRSATVTQAYSSEVQDAQVGIGRITHDLRTAYSVVSAQPNVIEFYQWANVAVNGVTQQVTEDVEYDCAVPEPGTPYDECTRVQAIYPAALPSPSTGTAFVLRLLNGGVDTYCNSNAVFHYTSASSNGSTATCTEASAAAAAINPVFVETRVLVPASDGLTGSLAAGTLTHSTVLDGGATLRNANLVKPS